MFDSLNKQREASPVVLLWEEHEPNPKYFLCWLNTMVFNYIESQFDHILHIYPDQTEIRLRVDRYIMEVLRDLDFTYTFTPLISMDNIEWLVDFEKDNIDCDYQSLITGEAADSLDKKLELRPDTHILL